MMGQTFIQGMKDYFEMENMIPLRKCVMLLV